MLGGSFWVALFRNGISAGLLMAVFCMMDHSRMKKVLPCYLIFGLFVVIIFSLWYLINFESFVRFAGILIIPVFGGFCLLISSDPLYLLLYKLTLGFYLLSIVVFLGVDISRMWFGGNMWVDIGVRLIIITIILMILYKKVRKNFLEGMDILQEEMDLFSAINVLLSIMIAAFMAFWPDNHEFSVYRMTRIAALLFMAGIIQYMVFHLYLHRGREHRYQAEKELLEMNEKLLRSQLEMVQKSEKEAARIRHDIRHHCLLMEEYMKNKEMDVLLSYVRQYRKEIEDQKTEQICGNKTINAILSVYARQAREENIQVIMHVRIAEVATVRDIDLVAILANIFENAIHGCVQSGAKEQKITISIVRKGKKIVMQCSNTCAPKIKIRNGLPKFINNKGIGVSSIMKVVSYYNGETDFFAEKGRFMIRVLLNIPQSE